MSLLKQLLISLSIALLGILVGSLAFNIDAAHRYLSEQLHKESENAATALALSLSQPANQDPVVQELLISALFDTGDFQLVRMTGPDGDVLIQRQQKDQAGAGARAVAPKWFEQLMDLPHAYAQRAVSNGWSQLGTIEVRVDNRLAQVALWQGAVKMALLIGVGGLAWGLFVSSLMRWFKRVLQEELTAQVRGIGMQNNEEPVHPAQVRELRAVTSAIADTHARVQQAEKEQMERIEILEIETNCDPVTKLPNRKYFVNEFNKCLQSADTSSGHVMLFRLRDLQALNNHYSRAQVNAWLCDVTLQVQKALQDRGVSNSHLARLNGSDFVLLLPQIHGVSAMQEVQHLRKLLQSLGLAMSDGQWSRWAYTLTPYAQGEQVADVLGRLDQALMQAENAGHGEVEYIEALGPAQSQVLAGESQWLQVLKRALNEPAHLVLDVQRVAMAGSGPKQQHHEATMELHETDGKVLRASLFLPAAVRLGWMDEFDLKAVELGLRWLRDHPGQRLVVRISWVSLQEPSFIDKLQAVLQGCENHAWLQGLVLEVDAYALEHGADSVQRLCDVLTRFGALLGLRRMYQSPGALMYMAGLPLHYVKLGGFFAEQGQHNPGIRHLVEAILSTAVEQGTAVYITEEVEPAVAQWLRSKGASLPVLD